VRRKKEPRWVSKAATLAIHEMLLAEHGGITGIRDEGLLDSALASPRNLLACEEPDLLQLAAAYAHALSRNHPFHDGNRRVALTVAGVFPELNGLRLVAPEPDAITAVLALSTHEFDQAGFAAWLRDSSTRIKKPASAPPSKRATTKRKAGTR